MVDDRNSGVLELGFGLVNEAFSTYNHRGAASYSIFVRSGQST
jgi:hypothetical protein